MEKNISSELPEILFSSSDQRISRQVSRLERSGKIRKITARVFTPNFTDTPEEIIRRNLFHILGRLYPGAVLSHRSAFELQPTASGHIFITHCYTKKISLPGVTLRFLEGPGPLEGDSELYPGLHVSQPERAMLENLSVSRRSGDVSKSLGMKDIFVRLEKIHRARGEAGLNEVVDMARELGAALGLGEEFAKLEAGARAVVLASSRGESGADATTAPVFSRSYDPVRMTWFEVLFAALRNEVFPDLPEHNFTGRSFRNFSVFEAWSSCRLEGIDFSMEEAEGMIDADYGSPGREEDSEQLLSAYRLVSNRNEMGKVPSSTSIFLDLLAYRHQLLTGAMLSGADTPFRVANQGVHQGFHVDHSLVRGTLIRAFDFYTALRHPFARAAFLLFVISEVHPFPRGNGLIARVMLNAELVSGNQSKLIFPPGMQAAYAPSMRRLSRQQDPSGYIDMLVRARAFSATVFGEDRDAMARRFV